MYKIDCLYTKHQIHIGGFLLTTDSMDYFTTLFIHIYVLKEMGPYPITFETDEKFSLNILHSLDPSHGGQKSKHLYTWDVVTNNYWEGVFYIFLVVVVVVGFILLHREHWGFRSSHKAV